LLDDPTAQVGVDEAAFGACDGLAQTRIGDPFSSRESDE
jgi:hypothetical protein